MKTRIVGFQSGHDVSYCVLEDGIPVICEELERISRVKMELGDGLKLFFSRYKNPESVKYFTFGNLKGRSGRYQRICGDIKSEGKMLAITKKNNGGYYEFGHHLSHAANAFFTSDFDSSLIITVDGGGWETQNLRSGLGVYQGKYNKVNPIKVFDINEINLGGLWHDLTKEVFELSVGYPKGDQAGSVMAMATLGKPKYLKLIKDYKNNLQKLKEIAHISEKEKFNVAASMQKYTETVFKKILKKYLGKHSSLCLSGGVSLNCVMLGKIKEWFPQIKEIFCDPVPYDAGLALGSARYLWHHVLDNPRVKNNTLNQTSYLGKNYNKAEILTALKKHKNEIHFKESKDSEVLNKIKDQKIVSVYGGKSETGRRALGNRSILADPRNAEMKNIVNEKIKHRQWFRPVAPSILEENLRDWFDQITPSPYMTFALKVKENKAKQIPAVVHYDGTARLQSVNKKISPWYHSFIKKWEKISGVPILINTSFNDSEPIVETPDDALNCFLKTQIDFLYFFDYGILVSKK